MPPSTRTPWPVSLTERFVTSICCCLTNGSPSHADEKYIHGKIQHATSFLQSTREKVTNTPCRSGDAVKYSRQFTTMNYGKDGRRMDLSGNRSAPVAQAGRVVIIVCWLPTFADEKEEFVYNPNWSGPGHPLLLFIMSANKRISLIPFYFEDQE